MDKIGKILFASLISISAVSWIISQIFGHPALMASFANPLSIALFTLVWTAGMAAMMFPAISPIVLLYHRIVSKSADGSSSVVTFEQGDGETRSYGPKIILFVGSYLAVWALSGIALLAGWSVASDNLLAGAEKESLGIVYGIVLIASGVYQFSPLKSKCLGYCESPMAFFAKRWKPGISGSASMGIYHGLYCLGCCWPYFLLMVSLGWMNFLWMALFAGIIFGEKIWSRGIIVARIAGVGFAILGSLVVIGVVDLNSATTPSMDDMEITTKAPEPTTDEADGMAGMIGKMENEEIN